MYYYLKIYQFTALLQVEVLEMQSVQQLQQNHLNQKLLHTGVNYELKK